MPGDLEDWKRVLIFALFFMVLDLRLVKIGCRDDNQFFIFPHLSLSNAGAISRLNVIFAVVSCIPKGTNEFNA